VDLKMKWLEDPSPAAPAKQPAAESKPKAKTKKPARKAGKA